MLGELLENRNGPTNASQQGAFCVPEPVTVRTVPLRTSVISLADSRFQVLHAAKHPTANPFVGEFGEPSFD